MIGTISNIIICDNNRRTTGYVLLGNNADGSVLTKTSTLVTRYGLRDFVKQHQESGFEVLKTATIAIADLDKDFIDISQSVDKYSHNRIYTELVCNVGSIKRKDLVAAGRICESTSANLAEFLKYYESEDWFVNQTIATYRSARMSYNKAVNDLIAVGAIKDPRANRDNAAIVNELNTNVFDKHADYNTLTGKTRYDPATRFEVEESYISMFDREEVTSVYFNAVKRFNKQVGYYALTMTFEDEGVPDTHYVRRTKEAVDKDQDVSQYFTNLYIAMQEFVENQ